LHCSTPRHINSHRWGLDGCREAGGGKRRQLEGKEKRADIAEIKMAQGKGDWIQSILMQLHHWGMDESRDIIEACASKEPPTCHNTSRTNVSVCHAMLKMITFPR